MVVVMLVSGWFCGWERMMMVKTVCGSAKHYPILLYKCMDVYNQTIVVLGIFDVMCSC